jgi:hypothetical protein
MATSLRAHQFHSVLRCIKTLLLHAPAAPPLADPPHRRYQRAPAANPNPNPSPNPHLPAVPLARWVAAARRVRQLDGARAALHETTLPPSPQPAATSDNNTPLATTHTPSPASLWKLSPSVSASSDEDAQSTPEGAPLPFSPHPLSCMVASHPANTEPRLYGPPTPHTGVAAHEAWVSAALLSVSQTHQPLFHLSSSPLTLALRRWLAGERGAAANVAHGGNPPVRFHPHRPSVS